MVGNQTIFDHFYTELGHNWIPTTVLRTTSIKEQHLLQPVSKIAQEVTRKMIKGMGKMINNKIKKCETVKKLLETLKGLKLVTKY